MQLVSMQCKKGFPSAAWQLSGFLFTIRQAIKLVIKETIHFFYVARNINSSLIVTTFLKCMMKADTGKGERRWRCFLITQDS